MVDSDYYSDCTERELSKQQLDNMRLYIEGKLPSCNRKRRTRNPSHPVRPMMSNEKLTALLNEGIALSKRVA